VANSGYDGETETRALMTFISNQARGIALFASVNDPVQSQSRPHGDNLVFIGPENVGSRGTDSAAGIIQADDASGISEAVRAAAAAGYRSIAYLGGPKVASNARRRLAASRSARKAGLGFRGYDSAGPIDSVAARMVHDGADVIACFDDQRALRVLDALRQLGVRVPEEVGVIGFDDIPFAGLSNPRLTTVAVPYLDMGRMACRMLLDGIDSHRPVPSVRIPTTLVQRESTRSGPAA
jgi:DNA-binding LacI/PurR family transcriptional regulator